MNRVIKVIFAGWAIAFGSALLLFLLLMAIEGANVALKIWATAPLSVLFVVGILVAWRYLK